MEPDTHMHNIVLEDKDMLAAARDLGAAAAMINNILLSTESEGEEINQDVALLQEHVNNIFLRLGWMVLPSTLAAVRTPCTCAETEDENEEKPS